MIINDRHPRANNRRTVYCCNVEWLSMHFYQTASHERQKLLKEEMTENVFHPCTLIDQGGRWRFGDMPSKRGIAMPNVFVEPLPKGGAGEPKTYALEFENNVRVVSNDFSTQKDAIDKARALGHKPLVARVRVTNKGNPDHWRAA